MEFKNNTGIKDILKKCTSVSGRWHGKLNLFLRNRDNMDACLSLNFLNGANCVAEALSRNEGIFYPYYPFNTSVYYKTKDMRKCYY